MTKRTFADSPTSPTATLAAPLNAGDGSITLTDDPATEMPTTGPFSILVGDPPNTKPANCASRTGATVTLESAWAGPTFSAGTNVNTGLAKIDAEAFLQIDDLAYPVDSVNAKTGEVVLTKSDVGLGDVNNTADADKPVSTAQAAADALKVSKTGDTMTGDLAITGGLAVTGAATLNEVRRSTYAPNSFSVSTLVASITSTTGTVRIGATEIDEFVASGGRAPFVVKIDNELMVMTSIPAAVSGSYTFTGTRRGACGTAKAAHTAGANADLRISDDALIPENVSSVMISNIEGSGEVSFYAPPVSNNGAWKAPQDGWTCSIAVVTNGIEGQRFVLRTYLGDILAVATNPRDCLSVGFEIVFSQEQFAIAAIATASGAMAENDRDFSGFGTPEGIVVADIGSTYRRIDGGAGTSFYVKEADGGLGTGWVAK